MRGDKRYQSRLRALQIIMVVAFAGLLGRLWELQVAQGARYRARSESNTKKELRLAAPRGPILDRNGILLAGNKPSYEACVLPARVGERSKRTLAAHQLATLLDVPYDLIKDAVEAKSLPAYQPVVVKSDLTSEEIQKVEENAAHIPGVFVRKAIRRYYPHGTLAAHVVGYVGQASAEEIEKAKPSREPLRPGQVVGKAGVEKRYDHSLRGRDGLMALVVDAQGRLLETSQNARVLSELQGLREAMSQRQSPGRAPAPGVKVWLTIDARLQEAAERALAGRTGVALVTDPRNGEILALVSSPTFDPERLSGQVSPAEMQALIQDPRRPFLERAHMGHYPPGSTFKMVTMLAALRTGAITPSTTIYCSGQYRVGADVRRCWKSGGHGLVGPVRAVAESCDLFFFEAGLRAGIDAIIETARELGLETQTGVDLPREVASVVPGPGWKESHWHERWYAGDTVNAAIGQGYILLTPIALARVTGIVASKGLEVVPHVVRKVEGEDEKATLARAQVQGRLKIDERWFALLREGMRGSVAWPQGTGHAADLGDVAVCGKTGSAETKKDLPEHAWFTSFAPADNPQVVCTVLIEFGGMGGAAAAPVAKQILRAYFDLRKQGAWHD